MDDALLKPAKACHRCMDISNSYLQPTVHGKGEMLREDWFTVGVG